MRVLCMDIKMNNTPLWLDVFALIAVIIIIVLAIVLACGGCLC
jgi:hypothetical protein